TYVLVRSSVLSTRFSFFPGSPPPPARPSSPTRRSSDPPAGGRERSQGRPGAARTTPPTAVGRRRADKSAGLGGADCRPEQEKPRSEEHTSELQSPCNLVCRLLLEKKK